VYSLWGLLAAAALLWPDRISGPFDGVPLDRITEAARKLVAERYLLERDVARIKERAAAEWDSH